MNTGRTSAAREKKKVDGEVAVKFRRERARDVFADTSRERKCISLRAQRGNKLAGIFRDNYTTTARRRRYIRDTTSGKMHAMYFRAGARLDHLDRFNAHRRSGSAFCAGSDIAVEAPRPGRICI